MRWSKKAALELSINAIVVLILAITILGLGIAFIRGQFGALQEQFSSVSGEVKTELINKIKTSGDLLAFSRAELDLQIGKKDTLFFGIKNNKDEIACTATTIRCIKALKPGTPGECATDVKNGAIVGGSGCTGDCAGWFDILTPIDIEKGETGVYPMTVQISDAKPDTYLMEIKVYIGDADTAGESDCENLDASDTPPANPDDDSVPGAIEDEWQVLATKQFTINLQ
ncbi:MAG: hypothetical protein AABY13_01985 [Nanoarchaeota archaeon]